MREGPARGGPDDVIRVCRGGFAGDEPGNRRSAHRTGRPGAPTTVDRATSSRVVGSYAATLPLCTFFGPVRFATPRRCALAITTPAQALIVQVFF